MLSFDTLAPKPCSVRRKEKPALMNRLLNFLYMELINHRSMLFILSLSDSAPSFSMTVMELFTPCPSIKAQDFDPFGALPFHIPSPVPAASDMLLMNDATSIHFILFCSWFYQFHVQFDYNTVSSSCQPVSAFFCTDLINLICQFPHIIWKPASRYNNLRPVCFCPE